MLKEVFAPSLQRNVKMGLLPRRPGELHLHFSDFVTHAKLPAIPATFDFSAKAKVPLKDIYGNDQLGDCAVAAMAHIAATLTGNATGAPLHLTLSQIIAIYSKISGYVVGNESTDNGCVLTDVLKYWKATGLPGGEKILGYVSINASNFSDVIAAAFLFENLFFGVGLPDQWISPFPSTDGFLWGKTGSSDPNNGHAFVGYGGVASGSGAGINIDSWGLFGRVTPDAIAAYAGTSGGGELYAVITSDMLAKGESKAPNGVAWSDLVAAFNSFGGNVPTPAPASPPPTLKQLEAWASAGIAANYHAGMTIAQVTAAASAGLSANWPK